METMADDQSANLVVSHCTVLGKKGVSIRILNHLKRQFYSIYLVRF